MKKISLTVLISAILGCSTTPVAPITAEISIYGITSMKNQLRVPLVESPTKMMRIGSEVSVIAKTDEIPMQIGTTFGVCAVFSGVSSSNKGSIKRFVSHPAMKTADGKVRTEFSYPAVLETTGLVTSDCHGYGLDNEFELLPGVWKIGFQHNEKLIAVKEFRVK